MNLTEILQAIPEIQRPTAIELGAELEDAARLGWTTPAITTELLRRLGPGSGPGATVYHLRAICQTPPTTKHKTSDKPLQIHRHRYHPTPDLGLCECGLPAHNRHHLEASA